MPLPGQPIAVTVPLGAPATQIVDFPVGNPIDAAVRKQWDALGIIPSEPSTDAEFIRRASLDIAATLPEPAEVKSLLGPAAIA